jgi:hypothetical protein
LCIAHGAKRKICGFPGCTKHVKKAGKATPSYIFLTKIIDNRLNHIHRRHVQCSWTSQKALRR